MNILLVSINNNGISQYVVKYQLAGCQKGEPIKADRL